MRDEPADTGALDHAPHVPVDRLDSGPLTRRQVRIAMTAAGGYFTDGYDLLVLSGALLAIIPAFHLSAGSLGALTAAAFLGMSVGSAVAGPLTDRFGRRPVFFADMLLFIVVSALMLAVVEPWQLIVLRFLIGVAIGADMPASAAIIAEFAPYRRRGALTAFGGVAWMLGALCALAVTMVIYSAWGTSHWRLALATGLVPAAVLLVLRHKTPETPHWLLVKGRYREAAAAWRHAQGADTVAGTVPAGPVASGPDRVAGRGSALFRRPLSVALLAMCFYWTCNNFYGSAILLYQATLIKQIVTPSAYTALLFTGVATVLAVLFGGFVCLRVIDRRGRRPPALLGTATIAVSLATVGLFIDRPYVVLVAYVTALTVTNGCTTLSYYAWSTELFPTGVRGRAVGVTNTCGKLGSVAGTLALPLAFEHLHGNAFLVLAGIAAINVAVTYRLAPETARRPLHELAAEPATEAARGRA